MMRWLRCRRECGEVSCPSTGVVIAVYSCHRKRCPWRLKHQQ